MLKNEVPRQQWQWEMCLATNPHQRNLKLHVLKKAKPQSPELLCSFTTRPASKEQSELSSKPISYAKAMPSNYCKTLWYSCLKFLCDQDILRRVLQCCSWRLQSHKCLGEPQHTGCHGWAPPPSRGGSPPLAAASRILQDLFHAYSQSAWHWRPHSGGYSVRYRQIGSYPSPVCAVVYSAKGLPKCNAAVMRINCFATTSFSGAWRHLLRSTAQKSAVKEWGCRPLWEDLGFPRHFPRAFSWNPTGDLQLSGSWARYLSLFNPSQQLSTTQSLTHSPPAVVWGENQKSNSEKAHGVR